MTRRRLLASVVLFSCALAAAPVAARRAADLPARLSDQQFWQMVSDSSEPGGYFRSDNLLSNEVWFQYIIPDLLGFLKPGGVYLGVGPEQNYTYIAALQPKMVFIFDVRRGNLHTQLMYKAIFELSNDRADFVSLLFSRTRPAGLGPASTAVDLFSAISGAPTSQEQYAANFKKITDHLTRTHGWPLPQEDLDGLDYVYGSFHRFGPAINYSSSSGGGGSFRGASSTYAALMTATDGRGESRSFLANDALFGVMKDLESRNLVVPVVGDFAGPKAIRAVGKYLKDKGATVTSFYLSNVEQYLAQNGVWQAFCNNVSALPLTDASTFIYSQGGRGGGRGGGGRGSLDSFYRPILADVKAYGCRPDGQRP